MAGETAAEAAGRRLASAGSLELAVPECAKGIGAVIYEVNSANLIAGVRVEPYSIHADDRGYFLEVQRLGRGLAAEFPENPLFRKELLRVSRLAHPNEPARSK